MRRLTLALVSLVLGCAVLASQKPDAPEQCFIAAGWEYPFVSVLTADSDVPLRVPVLPGCGLLIHPPDTIHVYAPPGSELSHDECIAAYHELQRRIREAMPRRSGS